MSEGAGAPPSVSGRAGTDAAPLIEFRDIVKRFGTVTAVDGVDLTIGAGEFYALLGPSGCGKTTLLRLLAGFEAPTSGSVAIAGVDLAGVPPHRRPVNMMFQSYALFPHMSVEHNIAFGLKMAGMGREAIRGRVGEMLDLVQLGGMGRRAPDQLSGGQRQRVALARALARQPKVLLLDEPLSALDKKLRQETRFELTRIQKELGITFVIVTHDQEEALSLCDRIAVMNHGRIEQIAAPAELYERPSSRWVASFIGTVNLQEVRVTERRGASLRLEAGGHVLRLEAADAPQIGPGEPAWLALRPEEILLGIPPLDSEGRNVLQGTLRQVAYYGERSIHGIEIDGCGLVLVSVSERSSRAQSAVVGEPVTLSWDVSAGRLLTR